MRTKLMLKCEDKLWDLVLKYKIDKKFSNNSEAVCDLIEKGLMFKEGKK